MINVQVAIMDPDGALLPRGEEGEIVYRGPQALNGYLKNAEATAAAFAHGWFHSGDVGALDDDGMLWFSDRYKDVIKTGGENVASIEVEKARVRRAPDVAEVAVVGLPHERWTEAITAVVVAKPGDDGRRGRGARRDPAHIDRVQGAEGRHRRRRAAQDVDRQDPEERGAQAVRRLLHRRVGSARG